MSAVLSAPTIDLETDQVEPVDVIAKQVTGKRFAPSTKWRWIRKGIRAGGQRIKLAAVFHAGTWCTTRAAFAAFIEAQTAAALATDDEASDEPTERTPETARRLRDAGLL